MTHLQSHRLLLFSKKIPEDEVVMVKVQPLNCTNTFQRSKSEREESAALVAPLQPHCALVLGVQCSFPRQTLCPALLGACRSAWGLTLWTTPQHPEMLCKSLEESKIKASNETVNTEQVCRR